jgi:hypothetical protein
MGRKQVSEGIIDIPVREAGGNCRPLLVEHFCGVLDSFCVMIYCGKLINYLNRLIGTYRRGRTPQTPAAGEQGFLTQFSTDSRKLEYVGIGLKRITVLYGPVNTSGML